ncbi:MAG: ribonuclease H-like domain-containing protein [Candidatus Dormibacteria bacterium]
MSTQLRLKLESLRGPGRAPRVAAPPRLEPDGRALAELGFGWDRERRLWVRRWRARFATLGLEGASLAPGGLRQLHRSLPAAGGTLVCFDLETTGLQRGTGTVPFLYGWAVVDGDWVEVQQWLLPNLGRERPLVEAALGMLRGAGTLVTYNGASFDLPLLRTRALMAGVDVAWPAPSHLDLLPLVRRLFRHRMSRCSLQRAEQELLGRKRSDDLPGSAAPERYRAYLSSGAVQQLDAVLRHNQEDLVSLLRLLEHLVRHLDREPDHPSDWYSLGRYREARGEWGRARALYRRAVSTSPPPLDRAAALRHARLLRRQGEDGEAREAWRSIWERWGDPEAAEALCVELEHQRADPAAALALAQEALRRAPVGWDRRFAKRIWRLQARLNLAASPPEPTAAGEASQRPWAAWLPGGISYEAWLTLKRGRPSRHRSPVAGRAGPT